MHDLYFNSQEDFSYFIKFWSEHMITVVSYWMSNCNGPAIRAKLVSLPQKKAQWDQIYSELQKICKKKPEGLNLRTQVQINTIEQMKLLNAVATDIQDDYFKVQLCPHCYSWVRGITKTSLSTKQMENKVHSR